MSNGRQLLYGWLMYAGDNQENVANAIDWVAGYLDYNGNPDNTNVTILLQGLLTRYVKNPAVYKCPPIKVPVPGQRVCRGYAAFP